MALDFKKLGIRSISAAAFVIVLLSSVWYSYISFTSFFFFISLWALKEYFDLGRKLGLSPYPISALILAIPSYLVFVQFPLFADTFPLPSIPALVLVIVPGIVLVNAVFDTAANPIGNAAFTISGIVYTILPFASLNLLALDQVEDQTYFEPNTVIGIILLIWSNDTFAYLGGSLFGKNKMIERVSPGKTWEGTIIGVLVTFGLSFLIPGMLSLDHSRFWAVCGILVPVLATLGDLLESVLKRQAGVKDSGNVMPGHGGILDRFDSLIFVAPFALFLKLIFG